MSELDHEILRRIMDKLSVIDGRVQGIEKTNVEIKVNLAEHMRRTSAAEEAIKYILSLFAPINTHISNMQLIGRIVMWATGTGVGVLVIKYLIAL